MEDITRSVSDASQQTYIQGSRKLLLIDKADQYEYVRL